ncbi:MAG: TFIIB-type zinc ribbon-containing protein [Treponema sp.]|nr:TFIIB-type zinc ribbon-containing protein [Treponema sp.]
MSEEYTCPNCQSENITSVRKAARGSDRSLMILCESCGTLLGVVNDLTRTKKALRYIALKLGILANP